MSPESVRQLAPSDLPLMRAVSELFADAFHDDESYRAQRPSDVYLRRLLASDSFVALAALDADIVVGALAAYELHKFERERSEIYIYDLAVAETHRRRGVATALIRRLQEIGAERGAWVIFVQADTEADDEPAIALYTKLGSREDVLHFDIAVAASPTSLHTE